MDPDMNKYDSEHVVTTHAHMTAERGAVYRDAWHRYYSAAHVETVLRRAVASGVSPRKITDAMTVFSGSSRIERVHPLQFGYVRRKIRTQRRHGLPVANPLVFYPWRAWDFVSVAGNRAALALRYRAICVASSPTRTALLTWTRRSSPRQRSTTRTISSPATPTRFPTPMARRSGRPRRLSDQLWRSRLKRDRARHNAQFSANPAFRAPSIRAAFTPRATYHFTVSLGLTCRASAKAASASSILPACA